MVRWFPSLEVKSYPVSMKTIPQLAGIKSQYVRAARDLRVYMLEAEETEQLLFFTQQISIKCPLMSGTG